MKEEAQLHALTTLAPRKKALNSCWVEGWLNFRAGMPVVTVNIEPPFLGH